MSRLDYGQPTRSPTASIPERWGCVSRPCGWQQPPGCRCSACADTTTDIELFDAMWELASRYAFDATCRRFPGCCPVVLRPCRATCECSCECTHPCGARRLDLSDVLCYPVCRQVNGTPALKIVENGTPWSYGSDFYLVDGYTIGACRALPTRQNLCAAPGSPGTWEIAALIGEPPPPIVLRGAADLACELVKACKGQDNCLPDGVRSIARRGVTMDVGETVTFDGDRTGVATFDIAVNQYGCRNADTWETLVRPASDVEFRFEQHQGPYAPGFFPSCSEG